jgi:predicted amidohydrolase YtcJ
MQGARRSAVLTAALAGTALLAAACSGGAKPVSAALTNYQKALAYSQCMRAHGEPGFPDPQPNGNLLIDGPKDHLNGALMNSAGKACKHLMPKSPPLTASQQQKLTAQALKFVACMRNHGIPNFPDPTVNSSGVEMQVPRNVTPDSAVFKNAQQACKNLIPGGPP